MRIVDRIFGWLMVLAALLHCMGTLTAHLGEDVTLWSLGAGLGELLLAAINLMRVGRPADRALAWVSFAGCLGWLVVIAGFAHLIHSFVDFRVVIQGVITLVLAVMSARGALRTSAA
ncbi:MAG: hypothetical protein ACJ71S_15665 [Acidobacteriaceae bacterium]